VPISITLPHNISPSAHMSHYPTTSRPVPISVSLPHNSSPSAYICHITPQHLAQWQYNVTLTHNLASAHISHITRNIARCSYLLLYDLSSIPVPISSTLSHKISPSAHICHITLKHLAQYPYQALYPITSRPVTIYLTLRYNISTSALICHITP
jgi:hypothetical protein